MVQAQPPELEREGFPKLDRLIGLTLKADVMAWINRRRTIADPSNMLKETRTRADQTNWDAI